MNILLKHLSPFAPDDSGAVSVLFEFGGLIAICDAGGCTGNVCGFDEPRWFTRKSAVFSAGLRDMDAILGRDDKLVSKLENAISGTDFAFSAIIGTPVPAIIATDFNALRRMIQKRTGRPALCIDTTGTQLYDRGEEKAYLELFRTFAEEKLPVESGTLGVIGVTPMDFSSLSAGNDLVEILRARGWKTVCCYGMGAGLDALRRASRAEKNLVVSPAGLKAAEYLQNRFGTPFEIDCPLLPAGAEEFAVETAGKKVLILHQQFSANALREKLLAGGAAKVDVGCWFQMRRESLQPDDFSIDTETTLQTEVERRACDVIVGDQRLRRTLRHFRGRWLDAPHFAVSGRLAADSPEGASIR